jgi:transcriptional regulator with XRE-family HTH domain
MLRLPTLKNRIGRRIRGLRLERRLRQDTLAVLLAIPVERVIAYESGRRIPPLLTLIRLAQTFGVGLDDLISDDAAHAGSAAQTLLQRCRALTSLPPKDQEAISGFLTILSQAFNTLRRTTESGPGRPG